MSQNNDLNSLRLELENERAARKQAEISLKEGLRKAKEEMELVLSSVGREMKTPLSTASGMGELLGRTRLDAQQQEQITSINYSTSVLLQLANNIETIAKIEAGNLEFKPTEIDLADVLKTLQETFQNRVQHKPVDVMMEIHHYVKTRLNANGSIIIQILTNLLANAEKLTDKGEIGIEVKLLKDGDEEQKIQFVVFDSGSGISQQQQEFFSDKGVESDLGKVDLGLWVVIHLVKFLKGEIEVTSSVGTGTRFFVTLPVRLSSNKTLTENEEPEKSTKIIRTLLVADENKMSRQYLKGIFEKYEVSVFYGEDGIDAMTVAQQNAFDLILLDIHMQLMNGIEAAASIRKNSTLNANTPIIGLATSTTAETLESTKAAGMNLVITKPFTPENLIESLSAYGQFVEYNPNKVAAAQNGLSIAPNLVDEYYGGDAKMALEAIELFLKNIQHNTESLISLSNDGRKSELLELVHKMKASFASVGMPSLEEKFGGFEKEIPSLMPARLKKAISGLVSDIQTWIPLVEEHHAALQSA